MKIEAKEILGKIYFEIKDFIQRTDILPEMEIFLNGNYPPILSAILKNKDLYFFEYKINHYKIIFSKDKVFEIQFVLPKNDSLDVIKYMIDNYLTDFKYYLKENVEKTEWKNLSDERPIEEQNIQVKTKRLEFDSTQKFEIENITNYEVLTFVNKEFQLKIFPPNSLTNSTELFYFELMKLDLEF